MPETLPILLTSAGRRVALLDCFRTDARTLGLVPKLLAADLHPHLSAACQAADSRFAVPRCSDPGYVPALLDLCRTHAVRLLVPTIDTELQVLADHRDRFRDLGTTVVVSCPETVRIARDKLTTARLLEAHGIETPRTATAAEFLRHPTSWQWPVILKPASGSSSKGIHILRRESELARLPELPPDTLVQELWEGREFTVNVFFDAASHLRAAVPHCRLETRTGEVSKGVTRRVPLLESIAHRLADALPGPRGPLCFQAILAPSGRAAVFEINARFGGGFPLAHAAGARFSRWLLEETAGLPSTAADAWQENLAMLRYDAAIFSPWNPGP